MGLILFCAILTFGQALFMVGGYQSSYGMMLAGRVVFGFGGECMSVAQSAIVSIWFKGKELAFALGLNLSVARLGSVVNAAIVPSVYDTSGLGAALAVGFALCVLGLLCSFGIAYIDLKVKIQS
jgi:MFS family permease